MHDPGRVGGRERLRDPRGVSKAPGEGHRTLLEDLLERPSGEILHGDEVNPPRLVDVVNDDDARVVQRRRRLGFKNEAPPAHRVGHHLGGEDLDGHETVQVQIARLVDDAHAALAELLDDPVVQERLTDHGALPVISGAFGVNLAGGIAACGEDRRTWSL